MAIDYTPIRDPTRYYPPEMLAVTTDNAGETGDPIPYIYPQPGDTITGTPFTDNPWGTTYTPPVPDCKEAITILEEAEYELKELLKKTSPVTYYNQDGTVERVDKTHQDLIVIALRNVQAALRALLKIG